MGNADSKIKCFNELNTRFSKDKSNYFIDFHECKSGLDSSFVREFPKGCYNLFCEDCYYKYYNGQDDPLANNEKLYETETHPKAEDNFSITKVDYDFTSKMPTFERDREMVEGVWPEEFKLDRPEWSEYAEGIILKEV